MDILLHDIETWKELFLVGVYLPEDGTYVDFEVSAYANQLDAFANFAEKHKKYYWVGYNNLRFDAQVIEWVLRNYHRWHELSGLEICEKIHQKANDTIDDANYDVFAEYKEDWLTYKQMDLFLIWHFNNKNRMVSLKRLEYEMDFENIEEADIPFDKVGVTPEDIIAIKRYCRNDVLATHYFYLFTIGETEHPLYKGKNKILDRLIIEEEIGLKCLNFDDVKIGSEWNKMDYMALTKRAENTLKPEKVNHFYGKKYKQFFPRTVSFQTREIKKFVYEFGDTFILNEKQEFPYTFNDELTVNVARGGLHSQEKPRFLIPEDNEEYWQVDIGSQYPNALRKYKVYPAHLGKQWNSMLVGKIERRLNYKHLAKETGNPRYQSLQEMGKLSLNGGAYGRLNTEGDWQEDPCCMLQVTIGCQMEILMIVEALVLKNFRVVSVNTDGFDVIISKDRHQEFVDLCTFYENKIGNSELGQLEYTQFQWIAQMSVNSYIALKMDGDAKLKGDFTVDFELHKNKSARVIPIALKEWFVNDIPVADTIKKHTNMYDFTLRQKSSKFFHYEGVNKINGKTNVYNKLIRYYISNRGEKIYKIKNPECQTNAAPVSQIHAGAWVMRVCNHLPKNTDVKAMDINYDFYIEKAEEIVRKIHTKGKKKVVKTIPGQLNLFD